MLTKKELEGIAEVLAKYPDIVVVCDEVYEYLTYDGAVHTSLATLPGMYACCRVRPVPPAQPSHTHNWCRRFERTLVVSSAGKTFSITGVSFHTCWSGCCKTKCNASSSNLLTPPKTRNRTGWKIGMIVGPEHLVKVQSNAAA